MARKRPNPPPDPPPPEPNREPGPKRKPRKRKPAKKSESKSESNRARRAPRTRENWKGIFLEALRKTGNVTSACEKAAVPRSTVYTARSTDPQFASDMMSAVEEAMDKFEALLGERIMNGSERVRRVEFFDAEGKLTRFLVERVQDPETRALLSFLEANRPEKWRHNFDPRKLADAFAAVARGPVESEHAGDRPKVS